MVPMRQHGLSQAQGKAKGVKANGRKSKAFECICWMTKRSFIRMISWHQIKSDKGLANDLLEIKQAGLIPED
jgi:hypothetical protein